MKQKGLRDTGIEILGSLPWSAHLSLFYAARSDLVDTIVSFFRAGVESDELCAWRWTVPAIRRAVEAGLRKALPNYDRLVARGSIVFIDARPWHRAKRFDPAALVGAWEELVERAGREKYDGLRACGEHTWRGNRSLAEISQFEETLHHFVVNRRVVFLCAYPLADVDGNYILDSSRLHHLVIARRRGRWDVLESPTLKATKEQIQQRNEELERAIAERTRQLARSEARALEARYEAALEERTRLAREIHDSLLQGVTGIALQLRAALPRLSGGSELATESIRRVVELAESTSRDARQAVWDMRAPSLVEKPLPMALEEAVRRIAGTVALDFAVEGTPRPLLGEVEDTIFRVGQEATLNVVKHAEASRISVTLAYRRSAVSLTITDDGNGFQSGRASGAHGGRWGVLGMRERAGRIAASFAIRSAPGRGTTVTLRAPTERSTRAKPSAT
jgi:signal transduction histidine kinase